jgi:hypothetical protein
LFDCWLPAGYSRQGQERRHLDQAEQWYRKTLEIFEQLKNPPLMVNTLAQFGVLRRLQGRYLEAVASFGNALAIATQYQMRIGGQIATNLARPLKTMGENDFAAAWRQAFNEEPPLEDLRSILQGLDDEKE